jgi:hypothetical protein
MRPWLQISFTRSQNETLALIFFLKVSNSDTLKPLIRVVETQGKSEWTVKCMHTKSDASEGGAYIGDIPDLPALATSRKKTKANKAVFHDLLTLPKNETLTPNFSCKVSNLDILKSLIKVK